MSAGCVVVIGAGAWGMALANVVARNRRNVVLIARDPAKADALRATRESMRLPGIRLDDGVIVESDHRAVAQAGAVLLVVPAQALRGVVKDLSRSIGQVPLVACAKGIERSTNKFMTEIIAEHCPGAPAAILSGPSFAGDVARGLPTAVTLAAEPEALAQSLAQMLGSSTFRIYHTTDIRGVEIGGAAKNVLAIAAGIVAGRALGASAAAALVTRGFAEIVRLGRACDARAETLMGLSGLGDLILTCSSPQSRNYSFGVALGRGLPAEQLPSQLAEGAFTAAAMVARAQERGVEMPIAEVVAAILERRLTVEGAIERLLARPIKSEE